MSENLAKFFFYSDVLKFQDLISIAQKKPTLKGNLVVDARTLTVYILFVIRKDFFCIFIFLIWLWIFLFWWMGVVLIFKP